MLRYLLRGVVLAALALGGPGQARAQGPYRLPPPQVPTAQGPGALYVAQVVDARPEHAAIGWLRHQDMPPPAGLEQDVPTTVQTFFDHFAPGRPGATPLLLRMRALVVTETPQVTASFIADFYTRRPDGSYRRLAIAAHRQMVRPSLLSVASNQHAANLGDLLLGALLLARDRRRWLADSTHYPAAYVLAPEPHPAEVLPALAADWQPQPGIYHSIEEFWFNAPSEPGRPEVVSKPYHTIEWAADSQVTLFRRLASGQLEVVPGAWGFSDGRRLYLLHRREYHPLTRRGAGFVFYAPAGDDPTYRALATPQISRQTPLLSVAAVMTAPSLDKRMLFTFDPLMGTASLNSSALAPPLAPRPTQLYLYRPRTAKGPAVRVGVAGGEPPRELAAGDYLSFMLPAGQPVQLCVQPPGQPETCLPVTLPAEATTYLEYRPGQPVPLQPVPAKAGAAALNRLAR